MSLCKTYQEFKFPVLFEKWKIVRWRLSVVVARSAKPLIFKTEKYRFARASDRLSSKEVVRFIVSFVAKPKEGKLC